MNKDTPTYPELLTWSKAIEFCQHLGARRYDFLLLVKARKAHPITRQPVPVLDRVRLGKAKGKRRKALYKRDQLRSLLQLDKS